MANVPTTQQPDEQATGEQERAELSQRRGKAATQIADPKERAAFVRDQGDTETKQNAKLTRSSLNRLSVGAAIKGYKKGTDNVPKTGVAVLTKGEAVLPVKQASKLRAAKKAKTSVPDGPMMALYGK